MYYGNACNLLMEKLLFEKLERKFLFEIDNDIKNILNNSRESGYGEKNLVDTKRKLKQVKKRFISKLIQSDYNSLLSIFFPQLKQYKNLEDNIFQRKLYNPDNWMLPDNKENALFTSLEKGLRFFSSRDNQEYEHLRYLRGDYLPTRSTSV